MVIILNRKKTWIFYFLSILAILIAFLIWWKWDELDIENIVSDDVLIYIKEDDISHIAAEEQNTITTLEFTVHSVIPKISEHKMLFLNSSNYVDDSDKVNNFAVIIPDFAINRGFQGLGGITLVEADDFRCFLGKKIRVKGKVIMCKPPDEAIERPEMIITHPDDLQILP